MILYQCTAASLPINSLISADDALLFRQDGVYLLRTDTEWPTTQLYVLKQDIDDRQLQCPPSVQALSDCQWVELCLNAQQVLLC
ncbi:MAG: DsrH/TusB family sulfur metabolism protein [Rheinheimera sp.]